MWRPDRSVRGPDRPGYRDIDPLNRVFAEAFTDRYSRDGLVGVRVPRHAVGVVGMYEVEERGRVNLDHAIDGRVIVLRKGQRERRIVKITN